MTTYFDTMPHRCPYCKRNFISMEATHFERGDTVTCECDFEYAKTPEPQYCEAGHDAHYRYSSGGEMRCAICDLKTSWAEAEKMIREMLEMQSEKKALEAIIEESAGELLEYSEESYHNQAVIIGAKVVEMIRDEARQAVIEAFNTPLGDLLPKREASSVCRCADPFAAID